MHMPTDGSRLRTGRFLGTANENFLHLIANWVSERTARHLRDVFEGNMTWEDFKTKARPHDAVFIDKIAEIHGVTLAKIPDEI